jgi:hypothetical protein
MVEYDADFARSFMQRTLDIAQQYQGPNDATLLLNCLLGLLVVPKESLIEKIPQDSFDRLSEWGIPPRAVKHFGKCDQGHVHEPSLRQLVRRLRNAVAHFKVDPIHHEGRVAGFRFADRNGFKAEIKLEEMKTFVTKLAGHLRAEV